VSVVTDDREIRDYANISGVKVCRIDSFTSSGKKKSHNRKMDTDSSDKKDISCSQMIDITRELKKKWIG